jgi:hypothetical protein
VEIDLIGVGEDSFARVWAVAAGATGGAARAAGRAEDEEVSIGSCDPFRKDEGVAAFLAFSIQK